MYDIVCEEQPSQKLLTLSDSLPQDEVASFLGSAFPALFGALSEAGLNPSGPPLARYHVTTDQFEVTAGVPFSGSLDAQPPMAVEVVSACTLATTVHVGSYDGLPQAFHAVIEWTEANGCTIVADPWESYLDGPEVEHPRTKVCFPVVRA